jgi:hypothetical protein
MVKSIVPNTPPKPDNKFVAARTATELQRNRFILIPQLQGQNKAKCQSTVSL